MEKFAESIRARLDVIIYARSDVCEREIFSASLIRNK